MFFPSNAALGGGGGRLFASCAAPEWDRRRTRSARLIGLFVALLGAEGGTRFTLFLAAIDAGGGGGDVFFFTKLGAGGGDHFLMAGDDSFLIFCVSFCGGDGGTEDGDDFIIFFWDKRRILSDRPVNTVPGLASFGGGGGVTFSGAPDLLVEGAGSCIFFAVTLFPSSLPSHFFSVLFFFPGGADGFIFREEPGGAGGLFF